MNGVVPEVFAISAYGGAFAEEGEGGEALPWQGFSYI